MKVKKVNAKKDRVITITVRDSIGAICANHQHCVIAKAIKRLTKADFVDVSASTVLVRPKGRKSFIRYLLNPTGREQVRWFDTKGNFAPGQVTLVAPPKKTGRRKGVLARSGRSGKHNRTLATR